MMLEIYLKNYSVIIYRRREIVIKRRITLILNSIINPYIELLKEIKILIL